MTIRESIVAGTDPKRSLGEFYKSSYDFEAKRRTEHASALSLPVGVLTIMIGALVVMAKEMHLPLNVMEQIQLVMIVVSICAGGRVAYFLLRSMFNFEYAYAPTPVEIRDYSHKLKNFHRASGKSEDEAINLAIAESLDYVDGEYAKNADRNGKNNDVKSAFLHKAMEALIVAIVLVSFAGFVHVVDVVDSPRRIQKIELVTCKEVGAVQKNAPVQTMTTPSTPPVQPPPPAPERPTPPPSRVIKEDRTPPRPPPS